MKQAKKTHGYHIAIMSHHFEVVASNGLTVMTAPVTYSTPRACRRAALKVSENLGIPIK